MLSLPSSADEARPRSSTAESIRRHLLAIAASGGVLVFGFGALGATIRLAGAVMAAGTVTVQSHTKKVSHTSGGIVATLAVADGSHVRAGDLLVRLDETVATANVGALTKNWYELLVQRARLEAERDGAPAIDFPPYARDAGAWAPDVSRMIAEETAMLAKRRAARAGQKAQMRQRIAQLDDEITGLAKQDESKGAELAIVERELGGLQHLYDNGLIPVTRVDALKRDRSRLAGERGALQSQVAQARGKIAETELQILQIDEDMRSSVSKDLADIRGKTSDVAERRTAALDTLKHLDIRAPQDGVVHDLSVHAAGAVIAPNEQIMVVVPDEDNIVAEVHVAPQDVDKVYAAQQATLRFPNLNQRTTPEVVTHVSRVAPDTTDDGKGGAPYYLVQLAIPTGELAGVKLRPGMPVEAMIATSERTMLSYLVKPIADQVARAFREK